MGEITISNEGIRNTFYCVATIENALEKEFKFIPTNKSHLDKLVPDFLAGRFSKKMNDALTFKDNITTTAYNAGLVLLVGAFERIVLTKYRTSSGSIKSILRDHNGTKFDYYESRENFLSKIDKLSEIINLIDGHISVDLMDKLSQIKDRRNEIAHGNLISMVAPKDFSLEEIAKVLDDIIAEIEPK